MEFWISTNNKGKLDEYKLLLGDIQMPILSLKDVPSFSPRPENGKTFVENARIKAKSLSAVKNKAWVLGEDSGLEVEGLGGLPGIHSARYAGDKASDVENLTKLLKMMQIRSVMNRAAQFQCAVVLYSPTGQEHVIETQFKGTIAQLPKGQLGFGYDPVFIPEGQTQTLAELGPSYKNKHSHRALAIQKIKEIIKASL